MNVEQPDTQDSAVDTSTVDDQQDIDTTETHDQGDDQTDDTDSGEQTEGAEEDAELEVDGERYKLPKKAAERIQAERMMQADYTRKTQELAAQRQADDAARTQHQKNVELHQQYLSDHAKVIALNDQLAQYDRLDWQRLIAEQPQDAMVFQEQRRQLEAARNQAAQEVAQKQQQFALNEQQDLAKRVQEASAYATREIPGWNDERDTQLQKYAQDHGIAGKDLGPVILKHPALLKVLHKAELYDQLAKKQSAKAPPPPPPKPVTQVSAAKPAARDPARMSTAEWMAHRTSQLRKSR